MLSIFMNINLCYKIEIVIKFSSDCLKTSLYYNILPSPPTNGRILKAKYVPSPYIKVYKKSVKTIELKPVHYKKLSG